MNREQKRKLAKDIKQASKNPKSINMSFLGNRTTNRDGLSIPEGSKVQFKVDKMKRHPDWNRLDERYRTFIEDNVDTIFTVEYDEQYQREPLWVCLKEDTSPTKWLFYIGDLKVIR